MCFAPSPRLMQTSVATDCPGVDTAKPFVTSVIIGAKRVDQLQQNLSATEVQLSEDECKKLDEVKRSPARISWLDGSLPKHESSRRRPALLSSCWPP